MFSLYWQVQCSNALLFALCEGWVGLMLLCSRINVETLEGSVTQLGASDDYHYARQVPLFLESPALSESLAPKHEFFVEVSSKMHHSASCTVAQRGCSTSYQSALIQGSIHQSLHLHPTYWTPSCGSWAHVEVDPCCFSGPSSNEYTLQRQSQKLSPLTTYCSSINHRGKCTLSANINMQWKSPFWDQSCTDQYFYFNNQ